MAQTITVPLTSTASTSRLTLGGKVFSIRFVWMFRVGKWVISIYNANDEPLVEGISLQVNQQVTGRYPSVVEAMNGELWMIKNPESLQTAITKDNINSDFSLIYSTTEELEG